MSQLVPEDEPAELEVTHWLRIVRLHARLIALVALGCAAISVGAWFALSPSYAASADVSLQSPLDGSTTNGVAATITQELQVAGSREVRERALAAAGPATLTVSAATSGQIITFAAKASTGKRAAAAAEAYAASYLTTHADASSRRFRTAIASLRRSLATATAALGKASPDGRATLSAQIVALRTSLADLQVQEQVIAASEPVLSSPATVPTSPARSGLSTYVAIGLLAGALIGLALAAIVHRRDDVIRDSSASALLGGRADAARRGLLFASISPVQRSDLAPLQIRRPVLSLGPAPVSGLALPGSAAAESYGMVRARLDYHGRDRLLQLITVTSATHDEGAAAFAANLASAYARTGRHCMLVCLDLRRPERLGNVLSVTQSIHDGFAELPGVAEVIHKTVTLDEVLITGFSGVDLPVLPAGVSAAPSDLLADNAVAELMAELRDRADVIVTLTPPVVACPDGLAVATLSDAVVVVARAGETRRRDCTEAFARLDQAGFSQPALVVVDAPRSGPQWSTAQRRDTYVSVGSRRSLGS